ncbi:hypothetical protein AB0M29_33665 [Streptomyces sp. NPDC051976]|uniref:hypothetical protein n=1 Tax=Streptomyces sp. NPDC051976 TaxID=3154947 RepID=UPI00341B9BAA
MRHSSRVLRGALTGTALILGALGVLGGHQLGATAIGRTATHTSAPVVADGVLGDTEDDQGPTGTGPAKG